MWNGRNMLGLDPARILLEQQAHGATFSLQTFLRNRPELCRVLVHDTQFPWLQRYNLLIERHPSLGSGPPAGYELVLDYTGLPYRVIARPASDFSGRWKYRLLSVNVAEYDRNHCRKLVARQRGAWQLTAQGQSLLDQLTY
jgi:hypothetical protein